MARRKPHEREAALELANRLYLQGYSLRAIGDELEVSHETIRNDLDEIKRRWQESTTLALDEHKSKELARIDLLEYEYWQQYEESKKDYEAITKKAKDGGRPDDKTKRGYEVTTRTESRTGNPSYLQGVERCIKMRMELLGLEAPKKQEHTGPNGAPIKTEQINVNINAENAHDAGNILKQLAELGAIPPDRSESSHDSETE